MRPLDMSIRSLAGPKGKSVNDDAMMNHGRCRDLVAAKSGINVHPKVKMPGEKLYKTHPWHRDNWR